MPKGSANKKSPAVEAQVIGRVFQGKSKREIAREMKLARTTVDRILSRSQVEEVLAEAKNRILQLAPLAVGRVRESIFSKKRDGLEASLAVLRGTGVLEEKSKIEVKASGFDSMSDDELRLYIREVAVIGGSGSGEGAAPAGNSPESGQRALVAHAGDEDQGRAGDGKGEAGKPGAEAV